MDAVTLALWELIQVSKFWFQLLTYLIMRVAVNNNEKYQLYKFLLPPLQVPGITSALPWQSLEFGTQAPHQLFVPQLYGRSCIQGKFHAHLFLII